MTIDRRQFVFGFVSIFALSGCRQILSPEENEVQGTTGTKSKSLATTAEFLNSRFVTQYQEADILPGSLLLVSLGVWGHGDYHYYIDGQLIAQAINLTPYDPQHQILSIKKKRGANWVQIWRYPRLRRTHYKPHQSIPS